MKIVLIKEVEKLGIAGDIRDVKNGYARNYLLPQNLAVVATTQEVLVAGARREQELERIAILNEEMGHVAGKMSEQILMPVKVGPAGRLYGSVNSLEIAEAVSAIVGQEIDRRSINLANPIREQGHHRVKIRFAPDVVPEITVTVYEDGTEPPALDEIIENQLEEENLSVESIVENIVELESQEKEEISDSGDNISEDESKDDQ